MMRYHFRLFRDVTWHSHRSQEDAFRDVSPYNYMGSMDVNPAGKVYDELSQMFLDADGHWSQVSSGTYWQIRESILVASQVPGAHTTRTCPCAYGFSTFVLDELKQSLYLAATIFHPHHPEQAQLRFSRSLLSAPYSCFVHVA